jgi:hypothetical protein
LGDRQRLQQSITTGAQLLDLSSPGLTFASEIAQHSFANDLRLVDHVAASAPPVLGCGLRLACCLVEKPLAFNIYLSSDRIGSGNRLRSKRFGSSNRFRSDRFGLALRPLRPLRSGRMSGIENLRRLGTERLGNTASFERFGVGALDRLEFAIERIHLPLQIAHDRGGPLEFALHGRWFESTPYEFERLTLEALRVESMSVGHS